MIKNIFYTMMLISTMSSQLYTMEISTNIDFSKNDLDFITQIYSMECTDQDDDGENLDLFTIQTNDAHDFVSKNLNLQFRRIDLHNLLDPQTDQEKRDRQSFIDILCDYEANKNAYGPEVSQHLDNTPPEKVLETWIKGQDTKLAKMPDDQKFMYHWIIEDIDNEHAFVGRMCVHTYIGQRPDDCADTFMLAFGLTIASTHRNKKIFSRIAYKTLCRVQGLVEKYVTAELKQKIMPILDNADNFDIAFNDFDFDNNQTTKRCDHLLKAVYCFDTDSENLAMHKVAQKIDATLIHSWDREISIDNITMIRKSNLFIICL